MKRPATIGELVDAILYPLAQLYQEMFFIGSWQPMGYRDLLAMTQVDRIAWVKMCLYKQHVEEKNLKKIGT